MSDRRLFIALTVALCASAFAPAPAAAQAPAEVQRVAEARVTRLRERFLMAGDHGDALKRRIDSVTAAVATTTPVDSITAGPMVIRVRAGLLPPPIRAAFAEGSAMAWASLDSVVDGAAGIVSAASLEARHWQRNVWERAQTTVLAFPGKNQRQTYFRNTPTPENVRIAVLDLYGTDVGRRAPASLKRWTGGEWIPLVRNDRHTWEETGVALATSRSSYARRCYEGVIADCEVALELTPDSTTDPLHAWYRPDDVPAFVSEYTGRDSAERALISECARARAIETCDRAAALFTILHPTSASARQSLVAYAMERGGRSALARLLSADGTAPTVLVTTAGIPLDQLLDEWRRHAAAAMPDRSMPGPVDGAVVLAWCAIFATLATRRRP